MTEIQQMLPEQVESEVDPQSSKPTLLDIVAFSNTKQSARGSRMKSADESGIPEKL